MTRTTPNTDLQPGGVAHAAVARWLAAEAAGREAEAERALAVAFSGLPTIAPAPGFTDRVMANAGIVVLPAARKVSVLSSLPVRLAILTALLLGALATVLAPALAAAVAGMLNLSDLARFATRGCVALVERLVEVLAAWQMVDGLIEALWLVLTSPPLVAIWLSLAVFCAFTFRWLSELVSPQRSPAHAS